MKDNFGNRTEEKPRPEQFSRSADGSSPHNLRRLRVAAMLLFSVTLCCQAARIVIVGAPPQTNNPAVTIAPTGDLLKFTDGSLLHGELKAMNTGHGITWQHTDAAKAIEFQPAHIDYIRFKHSGSQTIKPGARFRFRNGDDIFGDLLSLEENQIELSTWFGRTVKVPRNALESITFLSQNYSILYEGPLDMEGWNVIHQTINSWSCADGVFLSPGPGFLSRRLNLTNAATVEFDLAWPQHKEFQLQVNLYTDKEQVDYNSDSLLLTFTVRANDPMADLKRLQPGKPPVGLGEAPLPLTTNQTQMRLAIHANREENAVAVYANDQLVKRWKFTDASIGTGGNIVFYNVMGNNFFNQSGLSIAPLRLSHLRIAQWEGRFEPEGSTPTHSDAVVFINHDKAGGKILGFKQGNVDLALGAKTLKIPLARVKQIFFAAEKTAPGPAGPWLVRTQFPGGGSVSFQLQSWDGQNISGQSPVFGPLTFQTAGIGQIEFNLDQPRDKSTSENINEFGGLDE